MPKAQLNVRVADLTRRQLEELGERWGTTQTETLTVIIDRMYQQEIDTMTRKQYTYYAWASNDQGATVDVADKQRFSSQRAAEDAARAELGSGWTVHVMGIQHDGNEGWFAPAEIKTFRIR